MSSFLASRGKSLLWDRNRPDLINLDSQNPLRSSGFLKKGLPIFKEDWALPGFLKIVLDGMVRLAPTPKALSSSVAKACDHT